ncbi:MAG: thioredoxin family protein [Acidobacteriota bacterium]|nr:thioredoxin family protein [Acidobacteriota bacterium]MDE3263725.1 thioredoxin family protein [Acidobacteriota bacterium]
MKQDRNSGKVRRTAVLLVAAVALAAAASGQFRPPPKASVEAFTDFTSYAAGTPVRIAAVVTIDDGWHIQSHTPSYEYLIPTELALELPDGWREAVIRYPAHVMWQSQFAEDPLAAYEYEAVIHAGLELPTDLATGAVEVPVELLYQACDELVCLPPTTAETTVRLEIGEAGEPTDHPAFEAAPAAPPPTGGGLSLFAALVPALLGGLILNGMPCVLPIVSLKLFGFAQASGRPRREIVGGALMTTLGILVSFWALAGATLLARSAGQAVGWGIQFQNPVFVTFLALVLTLFTLNVWGLFEINLPHALASRLGGHTHSAHEGHSHSHSEHAASHQAGGGAGYSGHFFSGVFATLMATPCSAPFLGTAVGFALSQPAATIVFVFTMVGIGLATPYLLLAAMPRATRLLPRPGEWMVTLRGVMGFLIAGTTIWLLYVLAAQMDSARLAFLEIGLLTLALFIWLQSRSRKTGLRVFGRVGAVAAAVLVLLLANGATAQSRGPGAAAGGVQVLDWVPWDPVQAETLAAEGRLVFVDVTADWCATCKVNERLVLETDETAELFDRYEVVAMKADWTNRNDDIARYLASFGRYGIPFYALYRPGQEPHVFSELLRGGRLEEAIRNSAGGAAG